MNPRESSLLNAAAILLSRHGQDVAYGPAHAVRDALALETEVAQQLESRLLKSNGGDLSFHPAQARNGGAL